MAFVNPRFAALNQAAAVAATHRRPPVANPRFVPLTPAQGNYPDPTAARFPVRVPSPPPAPTPMPTAPGVFAANPFLVPGAPPTPAPNPLGLGAGIAPIQGPRPVEGPAVPRLPGFGMVETHGLNLVQPPPPAGPTPGPAPAPAPPAVPSEPRAYPVRPGDDGMVWVNVLGYGEVAVYPQALGLEGEVPASVTLTPEQATGFLRDEKVRLQRETMIGNLSPDEARARQAALDDWIGRYEAAWVENADPIGAVGEAVGAVGEAVGEAAEYVGEGGLFRDVGDTAVGQGPIVDAAGEAAADVGGTAIEWADRPRQEVVSHLGGEMYAIATAETEAERSAARQSAVVPLGFILGTVDPTDEGAAAFYSYATDPANRAAIEDAYANGYDFDGDGVVDFTGGRAVWEQYIGEQGVVTRAASDVALDPLNYLPLPTRAGTAITAASRALRTAEVGGQAVPRVVRGLSYGGEALGQAIRAIGLPDELPDRAVSAIGRGFRTLDDAAPPIVRNIAPVTEAGRTTQDLRRAGDAYAAVIGRPAIGGDTAGAMPTGGPPAAPPVPTITPGDAPPGTGMPLPPTPTGQSTRRAGRPVVVGRDAAGNRQWTDANGWRVVRVQTRRGITHAVYDPEGVAQGVYPKEADAWKRTTTAPSGQQPLPPATALPAPPPTQPPPPAPAPQPPGVPPTPPNRPVPAPPPATAAPDLPAVADEVPPVAATPEPEPRPVETPPPAPTPESPVVPYRQENVPFVPPRHRARPEDPTDDRTITRFARIVGPTGEAEVHRRLGRERYVTYDRQVADTSPLPQPDKELAAANFEAERRRLMREIAPDADLGEPSLTRIKPRRGAEPPGDPTTAPLADVAGWADGEGRRIFTAKDLTQMAMQRTLYRGWANPTAREARGRLYAEGVLAKEPPNEAVVARIADGTYRNPRGRLVPHTNVAAESLANVPPARRQRLAEQYQTGQQRAYERYQETRTTRQAIDPDDPLIDTAEARATVAGQVGLSDATLPRIVATPSGPQAVLPGTEDAMRPTFVRDVPHRVQRIEESGASPGSVDKPHGLYTSPADVASPHADVGGATTVLATNPAANVLRVNVREGLGLPGMRGGNAEDAGVAALRTLDPARFAELAPLPRAEIIRAVSPEFPAVDWSRFADAQDALIAYAGMRARQAGYDAIWAPDPRRPEFDEYVGLTDRAFAPAPPPSPLAEAVAASPEPVRYRPVGERGIFMVEGDDGSMFGPYRTLNEAKRRANELTDQTRRDTSTRPNAPSATAPEPGRSPLAEAVAASPDPARTVAPTNPLMPDRRSVPFSRIRTTRQLGEATDFQNRTADFSERTAASVARSLKEDPATFRRLYTDIEVAPRPDGDYVIVSGHSRHEGIRRAVEDGDVPPDFAVSVKVVEGTPEEIAEAATISNLIGDANTPSEKGRILRRFVGEDGDLDAAIARAGEAGIKLKGAEARNLIRVSYLPADVQGHVDTGLVGLPQAAALADGVIEGTLSPAEVQQFVVDVLQAKSRSAADIKLWIAGRRDLKEKAAGLGQSQGTMFDVNAYGVAESFDQTVELGRQLASETSLLKKLAALAKDPRVSQQTRDATAGDLVAATGRVNAVRQALGQRQIGGGIVVQDAIAAIGRWIAAPTPKAVRQTNRFAPPTAAGGEYTDPLGGRRLTTADEEATFNDPRLRLSDGTRFWDRYQELLATETQATGAATTEAHKAAMRTLGKQVASDRKIDGRTTGFVLRAIDGYMAGQRDLIMYSPLRLLDQPITQGLGNLLTTTLTGHAGGLLPWEASRRGLRLRNPFGTDVIARYELGDKPGTIRPLEPTLADPEQQLPLHRWIDRSIERSIGAGKVQRGIAKSTKLVATKKTRDLVMATDGHFRMHAFDHQFRRLVPEAWTETRGEILRLAQRRGLNLDETRAILKRFGGQYGPSALYAELAPFDKALAEHAYRTWAPAVNRVRDAAGGEVNRIFFSGVERGGAEAILRRVSMFHYFTLRQSALYASEGLRHPGIFNAYANAVAGFDRYAEERDLPAPVRGFLKLWGTGYGYLMYFNPVALAATFLTFRDQSGLDDQGFLGLLKDAVFISPLVEAALEYTGAMKEGLAFGLSDPSGLGSLARVGRKLYNLGVAHGLIDGDIAFSDPLQRLQQEARSRVSGALSGIPGFDHVPAQDPGGGDADKFWNLIVGLAMGNPDALRAHPAWQGYVDTGLTEGLSRTDAEARATFQVAMDAADTAVMEGAGNTYYDEASVDYANQDLAEEGVRLFTPLPTRERVGIRDETMQARDVAAARAPVDPDITYPGTDDPVFPDAAVPEGTNDPLGEARGRATATDEGRALATEVREAEAVGTEAGRNALDTWNAIAFGEPEQPLSIGGRTYTAAELAMLPDAMREGLANQWATERGLADDAERQRGLNDAYRAANPEYDAYKDWQGDVYDHPEGPVGWWEEQAASNPAAAAYLDETRGRGLSETALVGTLASPDAYLAHRGIEANVYQAELPEARPTGTTAAQPAYAPQDPEAAIADEVSLYRAEVAAAATVLIANGESPWVFEGGTDAEQDRARAVLARYGLSVPTLSPDAKGYVRWAAEQQARGADTSIGGYLAWRTTAEGMAAALTAPYYLGASGQGGDPLEAFLSGELGPWSLGMGPGAVGPENSYGYGPGGAPNIGTRLDRPRFSAGPSFVQLGGSLGTRMPR